MNKALDLDPQLAQAYINLSDLYYNKAKGGISMEMKDKLKKLRTERGLTQAQLAEVLFVSRSTVAKWENGLGLPGQESLQLLEQLYGISRQEVSTTEPEATIVAKNRQLHTVGQIIGWTVFLLIIILSLIVPIQILKGNYGFTPEMAAGLFADNPYIDTGDYRIYYTMKRKRMV